MVKIKRIYECTRPKEVSQDEWDDCSICLVAKCGYSRCFEPNPKWEEQEGVCVYEHCIENMPITVKRTMESCPIFGHDCPSGKRQVAACEKIENTLWDRFNMLIKKEG